MAAPIGIATDVQRLFVASNDEPKFKSELRRRAVQAFANRLVAGRVGITLLRSSLDRSIQPAAEIVDALGRRL